MENDSELLREIAQNVLLKSGGEERVGLAYGKMGMVVFLMHYARFSGNELYDEYAGLLLDDIYSDLGENLPVDLESGLCGIGWGTEYLLQNGFVEGEADEILEDIDRRIMERDLMRISDLSLETGMAGILEYVLIRMRTRRSIGEGKLFDEAYWENLKRVTKRCRKELVNQDVCREKAELLLAGMEDPGKIPERKIFEIVHFEMPGNQNLWQRPDGLADGNSGVGLKIIFDSNGTDC